MLAAAGYANLGWVGRELTEQVGTGPAQGGEISKSQQQLPKCKEQKAPEWKQPQSRQVTLLQETPATLPHLSRAGVRPSASASGWTLVPNHTQSGSEGKTPPPGCYTENLNVEGIATERLQVIETSNQ